MLLSIGRVRSTTRVYFSATGDCAETLDAAASMLTATVKKAKLPACGMFGLLHSSVIAGIGAAKLQPRSHDGLHDTRITGAAANLSAELVSDLRGIRSRDPQQNVARHHQHARRAKAALQRMIFVELPAQDFHCPVILQTFEGLYRLPLTHDRKTQTRACGFPIHGNRASAARPVLTPEMSGGEAKAVAQEIRESLPRLDIAGDLGAVQFQFQKDHRACISRTARKTVDACRRIK